MSGTDALSRARERESWHWFGIEGIAGLEYACTQFGMDTNLEISDLRLRLKNPKLDVLKVMDRIKALGSHAGALVPDLMAAIRSGVFFPELVPLVIRLKNPELLACVLSQYGNTYPTPLERCELLKSGFVSEFQEQLLNMVYEDFEEPASIRCDIVAALIEAGTSSVSETLKIIEGRMEERIQKFKSELDQCESEQEIADFTAERLRDSRPLPFSLHDEKEFLGLVRKAIGAVASRPNPEPPNPYLTAFANGASENVSQEFKSSLYWDFKLNKVNTALEQPILKTLVAFGNTAGGTLWIGVNDDGKPIGLKNDYKVLKNKDEFELRLRNRISDLIGAAFCAQNVEITFPVEQGKEICRVVVQQSSFRLFLREDQKQIFYVRQGNRTVPLQGQELFRFCDQRDPKFSN